MKIEIASIATVGMLCLALASNQYSQANLEKKNASNTKWSQVQNDHQLKTYPDLVESKWIGERPPFGQADKIDVHRIIKKGLKKPKAVVFILPGTNYEMDRFFLDDTQDPLAGRSEQRNIYSYLANRGYDVYGMSYRMHYVPQSWGISDNLGYMANWGYEMIIADVKEAVTLIKTISGVGKLYIGGHSFGGGTALYYTSVYWKEDIKGLILLDGGNPMKSTTATNSFNLPDEIKKMISEKKWATEVGAPIYITRAADKDPSAPAIDPITKQPIIEPKTGKPFATYMDWYLATTLPTNMNFTDAVLMADGTYMSFNNPRQLIHERTYDDNYWPTRLGLESRAMTDWNKCPYTKYDFDELYAQMDIPIITFKSGKRSGWTGKENGTMTKIFEYYVLPGYAHTDVYNGNFAFQDVFQRIYDFMENLETGKYKKTNPTP